MEKLLDMVRIAFRRIRHARIKKRIKRNERTFSMDGHELKYCYESCCGSESLLVVFSGFSGDGKPAAYNMVSTFSKIRINKLFILDAFGFNKGGVYYLGENGDFYVRDMVLALLRQFDHRHQVFCGSSKGGTAALYFGLLTHANQIIAGAPQYYIGDYLVSEENHIPILDAMAGGHGEREVDQFNRILPDVVLSNSAAAKTQILLHYSEQEHTYPHHIRPLLADLTKMGYCVECDVREYEHHKDVAKYFPQLCTDKLNALVKEWDQRGEGEKYE